VAPERVCKALKNFEELFLELSNVKAAEYRQETPEYTSLSGWASTSEDNIKVFLDIHRDESLMGEGLMRDIARRVQSLRKELGYVPTDVLEAVHIAELEKEGIEMLRPYLKEMEELVRAKSVHIHEKREEVSVEWHEHQLDDKKVYIAIS
jgi:isoleucyl-tRNA synthetase